MPGITIGGLSAVIKWGYHEAASLGKWDLSARETGGDLTAKVVSSKDFELSQPVLKFCVMRQNGPAWKWPVLSLWIADGTLHAQLGPQE